jgi:hypothetical protein
MEKKYLKIILISKLDWNMPWIVLHEMCGFFLSIENPRWLPLQDMV